MIWASEFWATLNTWKSMKSSLFVQACSVPWLSTSQARPTSSSDRRVLISLLDQVKTISSEQHVSSIAQPVAPLVARGVTLPTEAVRSHVSDAAAAEKEQKGPSAIKLRLTDNPTDKYDSGMVRSFEVPADKYDSGTVRSFEVPVRLQESTVTRQLRGQSQGWTTVQDLEEQFSQYCKQHGRDSTVSNPSRAYLFQAFEASIALARKEPAIPYTWEKFNPIFKLWEPWIKQGSDAVESAYLVCLTVISCRSLTRSRTMSATPRRHPARCPSAARTLASTSTQ
jgi:hypothetical protein